LWGAKYGHGPAMYNAGLMLETGDGGPRDVVESYVVHLGRDGASDAAKRSSTS
jgi:TPR repeat protein